MLEMNLLDNTVEQVADFIEVSSKIRSMSDCEPVSTDWWNQSCREPRQRRILEYLPHSKEIDIPSLALCLSTMLPDIKSRCFAFRCEQMGREPVLKTEASREFSDPTFWPIFGGYRQPATSSVLIMMSNANLQDYQLSITTTSVRLHCQFLTLHSEMLSPFRRSRRLLWRMRAAACQPTDL